MRLNRAIAAAAVVVVLAVFAAGAAVAAVAGLSFGPNDEATRCQVITFMWRDAGSPSAAEAHPFVDEDIPAWCDPALDWAWSRGITTGVGWLDPDPIPGRSWGVDVEKSIVDAAAKWGFSVTEGAAIVACESGGNPSAQSPSNDWGLWQHNLSNPGGDAVGRFARAGYDFWTTWDNPYVNSDVAGALWAAGGWGPWACARVL